MAADSRPYVELHRGLDSFYSSRLRRSKTGCPGECSPASATRRVQAQRPPAKTERWRWAVLDRFADDLAGLEVRIARRAAGDGHCLASPAFQTILVEVVQTETTGASADWFGDPQADPNHGGLESHLGRASRSRRAEKAGISDFGTDCIALDA